MFVRLRLTDSWSLSLSGAAGFVSPMKSLDGREVTLMPQDRFLLGGPLVLRGFRHNSIEQSQSTNYISESSLSSTASSSNTQHQHKKKQKMRSNEEDECYLGGGAFWRSCAQLYFPLPYLRRKNTWIADSLKGRK